MSIINVLYSRSEFLENANDFLESHALSDWCIISIDIERFKLFNNWYGQEAGDILLTNISQYLLRIQQMKGYLAGYFGGDHFFMCIPDDDQLINLIYKTIRSYIGIHSQNEGFLPIIGIYSIPDDHPDVATMCNNAQLAGSDIKGNFNKRISYFTDEIINQLEKEQQLIHDVTVGLDSPFISNQNATAKQVLSSVWRHSLAGSVRFVVLLPPVSSSRFLKITA